MKMRVVWLLLLLSATLTAHAQRTVKDSLKLDRILKSKEEPELNMDAVKQIDFGGGRGMPRRSSGKTWLQPDETLPKVKFVLPDSVELDSLNGNILGGRLLPSLAMPSLRRIAGYPDQPDQEERIKKENKRLGIKLPPPDGISLGNGIRVKGNNISGLDLMHVFTKKFWFRKKEKQRATTRAVLKSY